MPKVKCPQCGKETEFTGNEFRPFCSERCKLLDFGAWIEGEYAVPVEDAEFDEEELELIQQSLEMEQ